MILEKDEGIDSLGIQTKYRPQVSVADGLGMRLNDQLFSIITFLTFKYKNLKIRQSAAVYTAWH